MSLTAYQSGLDFDCKSMMDATPINIAEVIGKSSAVLHSDGLIVFSAMIESYTNKGKVILSFKNLTHCTTAFLNASIGKFLISVESPLAARKQLLIIDLNTDSLINTKIKRVIENAIDPEKRRSHDENFNTFFGG